MTLTIRAGGRYKDSDRQGKYRQAGPTSPFLSLIPRALFPVYGVSISHHNDGQTYGAHVVAVDYPIRHSCREHDGLTVIRV